MAVSGPADEESPLMTGKMGGIGIYGSGDTRPQIAFRGPPIGRPKRSRTMQDKLIPKATAALMVYKRDKRILAVWARYGIHDTIDGHAVYGAVSYMPTSAIDMAANIALYALWQDMTMPRPEPETQPASAPQTAPAPAE